MKKSYSSIAILLLSTLGSVQASAECKVGDMQSDPRSQLSSSNLIDITADYYPNDLYHLGYVSNSDGSINGIYYENEKGCRRYFNFHDLAGQLPIIQTTSGKTTYDLVRVHIESGDHKSEYEVTLSYMTNGLFKHRSKARCNLVVLKNNSFIVVDPENRGHLTKAHATTNFWGSKAVGIDDIFFK